ncbi:MAG: hypothetical protein JWO13_1552 [Acidobacteriales bacterium]|nr:hypothetical protein [Terriglobales bacterium]
MVLYRFYRFGCGVTPVQVESAPVANFPEELKKKYKSEVVVYSIKVGEHGIEGWHIISFPDPKLVGPAGGAIMKYKFSPATLNGKPVLAGVIAEIQVSDGKLRTPLKQPY